MPLQSYEEFPAPRQSRPPWFLLALTLVACAFLIGAGLNGIGDMQARSIQRQYDIFQIEKAKAQAQAKGFLDG